jgi:hypothetical protein
MRGVLGFVGSALLLCAAAAVAAANLSGRWALEFQRDGASARYVADCVWEQEGDRLSGSCASGFDSIVTIRGQVGESRITFQFKAGTDGPVMSFSGRLDDKASSVSGIWRSVDDRGDRAAGTFTAKKR